MSTFKLKRRQLMLVAVIAPLLVLFAYVAVRSGPLAPVKVTVAKVERARLAPALFGIGTVEARHVYPIGPTVAGRVKRLHVEVGDRVSAGQVLGEMDPVDLEQRVRSQEATLKRARAVVREAEARAAYAQSQAGRYARLSALQASSEEVALTRRQELEVAEAGLAAAREELVRARSDHAALLSQLEHLKLLAPVDGVVTLRDAEPGTTVVAGQTVVEIIDPASVWINLRLDQRGAAGLAPMLPARIVLRSQHGASLAGRVLRVEPKADTITEETLAKVVFDRLPEPLPPIGELAEVTLALPAQPEAPVIPNAAIRRDGGVPGVWRVGDDSLQFVPVRLGATDLDGRLQVLEGISPGDEIVIYSERALNGRSRIDVVSQLHGGES